MTNNTNDTKKVRTRIAPSPTGNLHVGTVHTAVFNYLFSKHNNGAFLFRMDDTDAERSLKEYEKDILDGLLWLNVEHDEPMVRQSERTDLYKQFLDKLLLEKKAFWCQHSDAELTEERNKQMQSGAPLRHVCSDRENGLNDGIIRFKNDSIENISFDDLIRGPISFDPTLFGDFSIAKNLQTPLYNFVNVIDDYDMKISHVIRGEDHISNTPKQMLIQNALNIEPPKFAHLPLLLGTDRSKLSKRHAATSVSDYRSLGYLPDAMFNYMALLGWNLGTEQEIFSRDELIEQFSLERVQKAGAIFDITKLDWINGEYIRSKKPSELLGDVRPYLVSSSSSYDDAYINNVIAVEQPRLKKLSEITEKTDYFFQEPLFDASLLQWKSMNNENIKLSLASALEIIKSISDSDFVKDNIEKIFLSKASELKDRGELLWPLRVALSGKKASPGPFDLLSILGKERAVLRIQSAVLML